MKRPENYLWLRWTRDGAVRTALRWLWESYARIEDGVTVIGTRPAGPPELTFDLDRCEATAAPEILGEQP